MKIATWNVNSLKVRLPQVLDWLQVEMPDVLALQETKLTDAFFPAAEILATGYQVVFTGEKSYNGVATLTKLPGNDALMAMPGCASEQKRFLATTVGDIRVVNVYVPNGQAVGTDKYAFKLAWLDSLRDFLKQALQAFPKLIVLGDFNIAPDERDVYDPKKWHDCVLVSRAEREALFALYDLGFSDSFRLFEQPQGVYSWWDYRTRAFSGNRGLRIDLILVSDALRESCQHAWVDTETRADARPSDHAPAVLTLA